MGTNNLDKNTDNEIIDGIRELVRAVRHRQPKAQIYVAGVFNGWPGPDKGTEANQMVPDKDTSGIYALTLNDFIPGKYQYKVIVNGSWMADPLAPLKEGSDGIH